MGVLECIGGAGRGNSYFIIVIKVFQRYLAERVRGDGDALSMTNRLPGQILPVAVGYRNECG